MSAPLRTHQKRAYRPDIDGLRALAIALVVINHFFKDLLPGGFVGVDVFFVISGFLITGIVTEELKEGRFSLWHFYARRILRLFPALATMLVGLLLVALLVLSPEELALLGKHIAASAGFVINFVLLRENGYFDLASDLKPLLHMWSLGVEEQFYLFWPIVLWLAIRFRVEVLALSATLIVSLYLNLSKIDTEAVRVFFSPEYRAWEFAAGGLVALLQHSAKLSFAQQRPLAAESATVLGLSLIGASAFLLDAHALYPGWRAIAPVLGAAMVLAYGSHSRLASYALGNRVSLYLGRISYPLYLWHWPVIAVLTIVMGPPDYGIRIAALSAAVFLAMATYHVIEKPVQRNSWLLAGRDRRVPALLSTIAVVAVTGFAILRLDGLPARVANYKPPKTTDYTYVDAACRSLAGDQFNYCRLSSGGEPPTIALLGDSHANHFFDGVAAYAHEFDESVINLGGCLPLPDTAIYQDGTVDGCIALGRAQLDFALNAPDIHTILVAGRMAYWIVGTGVNGLENGRTRYLMSREVSGQTLFGLDAFESGLRALVKETTDRGKRLVIFLDNPELDFPPASCLSQRPMSLFQRHDCSVSRSSVDNRQQSYRSVVAKVMAGNQSVSSFDPMSALCDSDRCFAMADGELLYRDDNHLSTEGSLYLADHYKFLSIMDAGRR